jgi:hypothetical protein
VKKANTIKRALKSPFTIADRVITEIDFDLLQIKCGIDTLLTTALVAKF